jgi:hypothetical protein
LKGHLLPNNLQTASALGYWFRGEGGEGEGRVLGKA